MNPSQPRSSPPVRFDFLSNQDIEGLGQHNTSPLKGKTPPRVSEKIRHGPAETLKKALDVESKINSGQKALADKVEGQTVLTDEVEKDINLMTYCLNSERMALHRQLCPKKKVLSKKSASYLEKGKGKIFMKKRIVPSKWAKANESQEKSTLIKPGIVKNQDAVLGLSKKSQILQSDIDKLVEEIHVKQDPTDDVHPSQSSFIDVEQNEETESADSEPEEPSAGNLFVRKDLLECTPQINYEKTPDKTLPTPNLSVKTFETTPKTLETTPKLVSPKNKDQRKSNKTKVKREPRISKNIIQNKDLLGIPLLEYGWRREIVYRQHLYADHQFADVYYFSPQPGSKKFRSKVEISDELLKEENRIRYPNLTNDHFTFSKVSLGLGEPYETERLAIDRKNSGIPRSTSKKLANSPSSRRTKKSTNPCSAKGTKKSTTTSKRKKAAPKMPGCLDESENTQPNTSNDWVANDVWSGTSYSLLPSS